MGLPFEMWMKLRMELRKFSRVCILTVAFVLRKVAQGSIDRHRSMVLESRAWVVSVSSVATNSVT